MVTETCCKDTEKIQRATRLLSSEKVGIVNDFSRRVLDTAEEIRQEMGYSDDPDRHFFPYNMHYRFKSSSEESWQPFSPVIIDDHKYYSIDAMAFRDSKKEDGRYGTIKGFKEADVSTQKKILAKFLHKLGYTKKDEIEVDDFANDRDYAHTRFLHPRLPIEAIYIETKTGGSLPTLVFSFYELNEHQLGFDLESTILTAPASA